MSRKDISNEEFAEYFGRYIALAKDTDLIQGLKNGLMQTSSFFASIPSEKHDYAYDQGKWSIKEVLQHIIDTERIFAYRALRIARNDKTALPGFEHDDYISPAECQNRSMISLIDEYESVRNATLSLLNNLPVDSLSLIGTASNHPLSARAAGFIIIGHEIWHMRIVNERYL